IFISGLTTASGSIILVAVVIVGSVVILRSASVFGIRSVMRIIVGSGVSSGGLLVKGVPSVIFLFSSTIFSKVSTISTVVTNRFSKEGESLLVIIFRVINRFGGRWCLFLKKVDT